MSPKIITNNTLFYGDNLNIMQQYLIDECVDLIYLDPPFNSNRSYNVLFKDEKGKEAESQIIAFEDSWHWNIIAEQTYVELVTKAPERVGTMISAMLQFVGRNQMMAYLVMMSARLIELRRVLKPTGSLYLHCDPTASHYLKIILDTIFGPQNLINEIVWKRAQPKGHTSRRFSRSHDVILAYTKSEAAIFNLQYTLHDPAYVEKFYRYVEPLTNRVYTLDNLANPNKDRPNLTYEFPSGSGVVRVWRWTKERMTKAWEAGLVIAPEKGGVVRYKRYLDEQEGNSMTDVWDDIEHLHGSNKENLGYPTQKPQKLLERIIQASSNPNDVVLDPFAGCGTSTAAAQKLGRKWIGIDITYLSIALLKNRLKSQFNIDAPADYEIIGEPEDLNDAKQLAQDDRYQFQWWALSLINARPLGGEAGSKKGKKGSDRGIDGIINFIDDQNDKAKQVLVQVKSGHVKSGDIRDLVGTVQREQAAIGVFLTLEPPTREMQKEELAAGFYSSVGWGKTYPKIQILTIADLLQGKASVKMPPEWGTFKLAGRSEASGVSQAQLDL